MDQMKHYFEKIHKVTDKDWNIFSSKLLREEFSKNQILLRTGQVENYLSFIEKGILRFYIPKEENDLTCDFAFDNSFACSYSSFLTRTPSLFQMETLTETVLWRLAHADLQEIYKQTDFGNEMGRYASEGLFLKKSRRELSFLSQTAEERYLNLFSEQPQLIKFIPLKYIASYIGITPQALSRIRKRIY